MKVLHVINSLAPGGAERLVADLAPRMASAGVEVGVYVLDGRGDVFGEGLRAAGVTVTHARDDGASIYSPGRLLELRRFLAAERPDIAHSHLGPSFHWTALALASSRGAGCPAGVTTEHAVHNRRMRMPLVKHFERWCYRRHARIACVSGEVARAMTGWLGLPVERLPVILNGVDTASFARAAPDPELLAWKGARTLVAMTARCVPAKDHDTALAAIAFLPDDFVAVFAGDGPERPRLEALAASAGISARCRFLGSRTDVPAILAAADLYLQSSRSEGFGIACLEAMAAGLPVVSSAAGGLRTLVEGAGFLFDAGDAQACAAALRRVAEDAGLRADLKAAGAARAVEYSVDAAAGAYLDLYRRILEER